MKQKISLYFKLFLLRLFKPFLSNMDDKPKFEPTLRTVYPEHQPTLNNWLIEFNVSSKVPKRMVFTKQQIIEKIGIECDELVII